MKTVCFGSGGFRASPAEEESLEGRGWIPAKRGNSGVKKMWLFGGFENRVTKPENKIMRVFGIIATVAGAAGLLGVIQIILDCMGR